MDKIGHISVHDFASVRFNQCKIKLIPYVNIGFFDFCRAKNLAAKFQNFSGQFWANWAETFSGNSGLMVRNPSNDAFFPV